MTQPTAAAKYERRLGDRYSKLVDQKLLRGLNAQEANELAAINKAIDGFEEPIHKEIIVTLKRIKLAIEAAS